MKKPCAGKLAQGLGENCLVGQVKHSANLGGCFVYLVLPTIEFLILGNQHVAKNQMTCATTLFSRRL